ncbi:NADH dehydrogenase subunit D [Thermosipho africanus H17ap60334]|jgi:NADH-quinone oxidoreductase subunit D|uniref:NADH-ubiquinone oxidoreductase 49 kDa subunit n=1 Tax=Thermosipho africanus (strain TCF52B) TaxID=484019 RepID=B7IDP4_THEAB|nr:MULTISPECIES: NADH-quinone oxidoreductase subunit D [Thermosipho]ACJ76121.1 NADH-ubiquinone oxidoreductase 49 kda subunit [Thermosipho africanus TCF52B]EKF49262.1 NADH dehydrogenase subunit D [Thermosipho africanus H17ap60334]MBZ4649930.1 NADH-ubiquinone oxidoreductase 49 kda subunit [Thermosipho sp. (in: thermotogales)]MDK2900313.1 NADH-quinone oxidoreductase subunit [Thermosipho sp. (in: thermotogales)]RDI92111.1 NADH dehydrogenase subunit D [Thermosipho africanus Ob7]
MGEVKLFFGPNHPGMHGNFSVHLYVEGDTVIRARPMPGFLHRGFEKLMERRLWYQNLALIPRICVPEPDINEVVYALAVEKLANVEVPERAQWIRMIVLELARIAVHLMSMAGIGGPIGLYTGPYWGVADRDRILDIFENLTGARIYHMYIIPGGVRKDMTPKVQDMIVKFLDYLESRLPEFENLIFKNRIVQTRLKGIALLDRETAFEMGVTGIGLRATGIPYDIRKIDPYLFYDKVEFEVPTATEGDAFSRVYLKFKEIPQSIRIIRQCLEKMPEGKINVPISEGNALRYRVPKGSVYVHIEASRGEYGYYVVSDGGEKPYRIVVRGASYPQTLYGIEKYLPGTRIEDVPIWLDTMGVCSPEVDR